jgi:hypothetical protein
MEANGLAFGYVIGALDDPSQLLEFLHTLPMFLIRQDWLKLDFRALR